MQCIPCLQAARWGFNVKDSFALNNWLKLKKRNMRALFCKQSESLLGLECGYRCESGPDDDLSGPVAETDLRAPHFFSPERRCAESRLRRLRVN